MTYQRDKVGDVIEVLTVIKNEHQKSTNYQNITSLRILATKIVAEMELNNNRYKNITSANRTIHDALARRLRPDIKNIKEFDEYTNQWLRNGSMKLKDILLGNTESITQSSKVEFFFTGP
jgi:L-ribulose-5-phosphate 3-epimerase UlaE